MSDVRVLNAIAEVAADAWDALLPPEASPFLEWTWLDALETTECVTARTGWRPQHLTLWEAGRLIGACPLYVKAHSLGEFVFDQGWAQAAERAGIGYYPKLLVAVPFTPATGARFLASPGRADEVIALLGAVLESFGDGRQYSSVHVNFCLPHEIEGLAARRWLRRTGFQYQWRNEGFATFEDYLASLRSKRRNQVRREQRALDEQGVVIDTIAGDAITEDMAPLLHRLYQQGIDRHVWGRPYLTPALFQALVGRWRHRLVVIVARQAGEVVAGTINVAKAGVLYGRYWGALRDLRHLHFNVGYYAAIAYCIARGFERFEPGAGGEFKHLRAFEATPTTSMHWIGDRRLRAAVDDYLERERAAVTEEVAWWDSHSARRRDGDETP